LEVFLIKTLYQNPAKEIFFLKMSFEEMFKNCNSNHVFKKSFDIFTRHDCLVMLEKPSIGFICNEYRKSVKNKDMAKFRCNGLAVVSIFDEVDKIFRSFIRHLTILPYTTTSYEVGKLVKPNSFNPNLDEICTHGIHYFLTLKAAKGYQDGVCVIESVRYDDDGQSW
jgi:hypothetical protein